MAVENENRPEVAGLSQTVRVALTSQRGVQLPAYDSFVPLPLTYPGVSLLARLARGADETLEGAVEHVVSTIGGELDVESLWGLIDELESRSLLVHGPGRPMAAASKGASSPSSALVDERSGPLLAQLPVILHVSEKGFEAIDHAGALRICLAPEELMALAAFREPIGWPEAFAAHQEQCGAHALGEPAFRGLVARLRALGLLHDSEPSESVRERAARQSRKLVGRREQVQEAMIESLREHEATERERRSRTGVDRVRVVPVMRNWLLPPLALGMVVASARAYQGGRLEEHYQFVPDWESRVPRLQRYAREHGVYLFSNYVWSHRDNMELSRQIKEINPHSVTVHGGPDAPKYPNDIEVYFRDHPHVDVIVHGEGEATICHLLEALVGAFGEGAPDLLRLEGVAGLSFRSGDGVVQNAARPQIMDIDTIPSPYLEGLFSAYEAAAPPTVIIETNRGCPFACTFCDWGSATQSKIRRFSLERVFAELEWCARNRTETIFIADANFGMLERDVAIAERVAELKEQYGYPVRFGTNYAKNNIKYLRPIVEMLVDADIVTEGLLSLQSMDAHTLSVIKRSNIKTEKYDELAREFRKAGLPLFVDIMLGLPGSTTKSFENDLQQCIEREVTAKVFQTELLTNSPMNDPAYREEHKIETATAASGFAGSRMVEQTGLGRAIVVSTATFSRQDYFQMLDLRRAFRLLENFGVLRQVTRFMRQAACVREIDLIERLRSEARADPERWPYLAFTLSAVPEIMAPPSSWALFIEEVRRFLLESYPIQDDSALRTVLDVQHALLPAQDRSFPVTLSLSHDYAAWHRAMIEAKDTTDRDRWPEVVPPLREYPPARFEVTDPNRVCTLATGYSNDDDFYGDWELTSPVARAMQAGHVKLAASA